MALIQELEHSDMLNRRLSQLSLVSQRSQPRSGSRSACNRIQRRSLVYTAAMSSLDRPYEQWSIPQLIQRVQSLEDELKAHSPSYDILDFCRSFRTNSVDSHNSKRGTSPSTTSLDQCPKKRPRAFDPSKYSTRFIALKFAYLGQGYNGFEYHKNNETPLPTIEEELWKALVKSKLISPASGDDAQPDWEGLEYSKCGRTDQGVSAFGQVVALRVRSSKPAVPPSQPEQEEQEQDHTAATTDATAFEPARSELPYPQILNRLLPPTIRVLAWCPNPPPSFSARFACTERKYKYFFTNPCVLPSSSHESSTPREGHLDITAMQEACKLLEGLHDFRNLAKLDPSKQLNDFSRRIFHASIDEIPSEDLPAAAALVNRPRNETLSQHQPTLHALSIHGSAFLWHQIRHIASILFLVGQGLESPSIIPQLLDIKSNPRRPHYEMADPTPLVLWDCRFSGRRWDHESGQESKGGGVDLEMNGAVVDGQRVEEQGELDWVYTSDTNEQGKETKFGLLPHLWETWRKTKMDEVLAGSLLNIATRHLQSSDSDSRIGNGTAEEEAVDGLEVSKGHGGKRRVDQNTSTKVFLGGNTHKLVGKYVPLLQRGRMDSVEVVNRRYKVREEGKGKVVKGSIMGTDA